MATKRELAKENFSKGLNCAQAVVLAFKDELGIDEQTLKKLAISFGGGLGRQRLTCGAVSGMCMVLGYLLSDGEDKLKIYQIVQKACGKFKEMTGSIICSELLSGVSGVDNSPIPEARTNEYYRKRPCSELCEIASEIAENILKGNY